MTTTENITARSLMLAGFATIPFDARLGSAMDQLVDLQSDINRPNALVVLNAQGKYEGILTARLLCKSLLTLWMPGKAARENESLLQQELLEVVRDRSNMKVHDALIRGLPTAAPWDRLLTLIEMSCDSRLEFVPVVDDGQARGLVPVTAIFLAAASLALTPEDEGIRFDQ